MNADMQVQLCNEVPLFAVIEKQKFYLCAQIPFNSGRANQGNHRDPISFSVSFLLNSCFSRTKVFFKHYWYLPGDTDALPREFALVLHQGEIWSTRRNTIS